MECNASLVRERHQVIFKYQTWYCNSASIEKLGYQWDLIMRWDVETCDRSRWLIIREGEWEITFE